MEWVEWFDAAIGVYAKKSQWANKKIMKIKFLSFQLGVLREVRHFILILISLSSFLILLALSMITILYNLLYLYNKNLGINWDPPFIFAWSVLIISAVSIFWLLKEESWLKIFGLKKKIEKILLKEKLDKTDNSEKTEKANLNEVISKMKKTDLTAFVNLVDSLVENKVKEISHERKKGNHSSERGGDHPAVSSS